jgi:hypothetical protein
MLTDYDDVKKEHLDPLLAAARQVLSLQPAQVI